MYFYRSSSVLLDFAPLLYGYPTYVKFDLDNEILEIEAKSEEDQKKGLYDFGFVRTSTIEGVPIRRVYIFSLSELLNDFIGTGLEIEGFEIRPTGDGAYSFTINGIPLSLEPLDEELFGRRPKRRVNGETKD
jgi:hypothetical protein